MTRPFEKGGHSRGSGLGLSIAAEVARAHDGELTFARGSGLTLVRMSFFRPN
jgi:two-component system sensor histidine kinase TctE